MDQIVGFDDYCMVLMTLAGFKLKTNNSELKLTYQSLVTSHQ